jgi:hypothetical protein
MTDAEVLMEYETALTKSWVDLKTLAEKRRYQVRFLADRYDVDLDKRQVLSLSCNTPASAHASIIILHYLKESIVGLPPIKGEWMAFQELVGGQGYYTAFKKRVIDRIATKYEKDPQAIIGSGARLGGSKADLADFSVVINAFDGVPILVELWKADEEFGPSADVLFDKTIEKIFCTEDIVALSEFLASQI